MVDHDHTEDQGEANRRVHIRFTGGCWHFFQTTRSQRWGLPIDEVKSAAPLRIGKTSNTSLPGRGRLWRRRADGAGRAFPGIPSEEPSFAMMPLDTRFEAPVRIYDS